MSHPRLLLPDHQTDLQGPSDHATTQVCFINKYYDIAMYILSQGLFRHYLIEQTSSTLTQLKIEICEQQLQAWFGDVGGVAPDAGRLSEQSSLLENRGSIQELYPAGKVLKTC